MRYSTEKIIWLSKCLVYTQYVLIELDPLNILCLMLIWKIDFRLIGSTYYSIQ